MRLKMVIVVVEILACFFSTGIRANVEAAKKSSSPVKVELVTSVEKAQVGSQFRLGVLLKMDRGWHIYWTFPGNTGKPTRVSFEADRSCSAVEEPSYPAPEVYKGKSNDELSFVYNRQVLIWSDAVVFDKPESGKAEFRAKVEWLACRNSCVPGSADLALSLALGKHPAASKYKDLFEKAVEKTPRPLPLNTSLLENLEFKNGTLSMRVKVHGLSEVTRFVPTWLQSTACMISGYSINESGPNTYMLNVSLKGPDCLPWAGGVIETKRKAGKGGKEPVTAYYRAIAHTGGAGTETTGAETPLSKEERHVSSRAGTKKQGESPNSTKYGFWLFLLLAFLGGMILNIMPCVIPVVVPKLMHLVRTANRIQDPIDRKRHLFKNALAYTAGVMLTMLAIGGIVVILRSIGVEVGWGFQFQNPYFLVFMIALLLVLGLGMLEVFPLRAGKHAEGLRKLKSYRGKSPLLESLMTGLLVTFLGTPCTAPMLGPALGYAFTRGTFEILLLLAVVGFGLSFPFLVLGVWTGWTGILPKRVSKRYDRIMRGLSFLLFATGVWLVGVLADGFGIPAATRVLWLLLGLAFAAWIFGIWAREEEGWGKRLTKLLPLLVLVFLLGWYILDFSKQNDASRSFLSSSAGIEWTEFSEERLNALKGRNKPLFLDFTAEWCMNCKFNEKTVIETEHTRDMLKKLGFLAIKADNTRRSPVINKWLKRFGRAGVPMYLVYPPCASDGQAAVLPEILTRGILDNALKEAAAKTYCK
ncbi:MAG: DUF255 domain-containing protein [Deltaproteobacteria bacterium]|nr:DUF255 domain-containing protein [Deltaproteobacteria bacterium]